MTAPLTGYKDRMALYCKEMKAYRFKLFGAFVLALIVTVGGAYIAGRVTGEPLAQDWQFLCVGLSLVMMIPLAKMFRPEEPTHEDVIADRALRRAAGADDKVAPPGSYT